MQLQTISNRYKLSEEFLSDSLDVLYRSQDLHDNKPVLVSLLSGKSLSRPLEVLLRFKRSAEQVSKLSHPNLLQVLSVGESENLTYLVYESFDSQILSKFLNQPWDIDKSVDLILQIASALSIAHEQNILHQAIQPANILISQSQPQTAKLFNFGFSILKDISKITEKEDIITTFGYLSPESSGILRKPIDGRSDIYSLGILFYQLLTGRLPYIADDISNLIHQHIATKPVAPSKLNSRIPPVLDNIVLRLIAKEPSERYQSITGLIFDLMQYQGQRAEGKELVDFEIAMTDRLAQISFSTKLIGRDKELNQLNKLLGQSKEGHGSLAFVYGEPGIGKSRLVDELRGSIHSLNGLFCGGKCYQYEFRTPYKVFSEAIDAYVEKIKRLSQKEREAHIKRIKETLGELGGEVVKISPSITDLIGQPPKLAELEADKEQIRFLITVTDFLISLSAPGSPLLMFLDDLQWADDGSLEILERFAEKLSSASTLLIVSYRDTEVDQNHPLARLIKKLSDQGTPLFSIPVKSFSLPDTAQMVSQILIEKEEQAIPLAGELQERAKGNPFFTLELLHSLVDSGIVHLQGGSYTYDLEKIKTANLPTTIVDAVIKRMKDLSEDAHKILSYASVMGREINFELLADIASRPTDLILNSIEDGIQNQLLYRDVTGKENVFFMHDRIREAFYERVPREDLPPLHRQIAEAMEEENKNDFGPVLYELAHHFTLANVKEKALEYSLRAADKAKTAYAYTQAVELYSNALSLMPDEERAGGSQRWIQIKEDLGDVYRMVGKFDESIESLRECEKFVPRADRVRRAQILNKIGEAIFDKGENLESAKCLEEALSVLGERTPKTVVGLYLGILKEFAVQMLHTYFYSTMVKKEFTGDRESLITANLCHRIAHVYYNIDVMKMLHLALKAFNIYEAKVGPCSELAYMHGTMGPVWGSIPWFSRAFREIDFGLRMCQKLGDTLREGCTYAYLCMLYYEVNKTKEAIEYGEKSIAMLKKLLGEFWALGVASSFVIYACIHNGEIQKAYEINKEVSDIFNKVKAAQTNGWVFLQKSIIRCFRGDVDEQAIADFKQAKLLLEQAQDKPSIMQTTAYLGFIHFRREEYDKAIEYIDEALRLFPTHYNKATWLLDMFTIGAEIYMVKVLRDTSLSKAEAARYLKKAKFCCKQAFSWGGQYKPFLGWAYQVNGTYLWLTGNKKNAVKTWENGLKHLREKTEDKYRIAYILLEEAKFLLQDNPQDKKALGNLLEAKELFSSMGCTLDLDTCNTLISKIMPSGEGLEGREALTQRRHLESLLSTTRAIGSVFVLDELLNKIMDYALKVTGAERGFLLLYDDKTNQLSLKLSNLPQAEPKAEGESSAFSFEAYKLSLELIREAEKQKDTIVASSESSSNSKIQSELKNYNVKQALAAYLTSRDKPIGILYLDNQLSSGTFGKQELELMQSFAVQASVSLENAHLVSDLLDQARLRQEMELGREIQMDLLPKVTPTIPGLKVNGIMLPAKEIGGDYYDFLLNPGLEQLSIVIGDVSGKGVAAGLLMAMVKTCLYALNKQPITPKAILLSTNQMLYEHINAKKFMTMLYLNWDAKKRNLSYSSAGHEHILIYRAQGPATAGRTPTGVVEAIVSGGFMLGMVAEIDSFLEDKQLNLNPGDKVILYTDGVTEARNPNEDLFGLDRLLELIQKHGSKPPEQLLLSIKEEVYSFIDTREQYDDITLVVMEAT